MNLRTLWLFGMVVVLFGAVSAKAQGRFEVTPFVGYETSASYPLSYQNNNSQTPIDRLRVNDALAFGTFLGFNLTENAQLEVMWDRNNTSFSAHNPFTGDYFNAFHSVIDQYQFGGLYMLRNSEHKLRPYIAGSLGFTHEFNSNGNPDRTEFAYSLGGGVKYYLTRHIGLRGDIRYMPTYGSSSYETYCDYFYGCYSAKVSHYLNRANFVGGVILHF
jgi:Outer membrane protein beta-barrel domain